MSEIVTGKVYWSAEEILALDWKKNPRPLRNRGGGMYRVVDKKTGKLLYVGQATNLSWRLAPSVHPVYRRELHDVYILFEQDHDMRCHMEGQFIRLLKPKRNKRNGTMPKPTDDMLRECYNRVFNESSCER